MTLIRVIIAYCLLAAVTPLVRAQPAGAQAEVLFREGRDLMAAGKTAEACASFEQSQKLDPVVTTLLNLAACREKLGQLATAWGLFLEVERQTRSANDRASEQLHKVARDRAAKLEPRVPKLTISVPDRSKLDGLEILRNNENVSSVMWNRALPVDGGTYTITARAPGTNEWSTRVTLTLEADIKTIDIPDLRNLMRDLDKPPEAPTAIETASGQRQTTQPAAPSAGGELPESLDVPMATGRRGLVLPVALGAGAAVVLGSALGFSLWGDSTYDEAKAEMTDQARRDSLYDSANRKRFAAQGLAVAGVGCAGVAVWLYLRQRSASTEPTSAARLIFVPTGSGIGVVGRF